MPTTKPPRKPRKPPRDSTRSSDLETLQKQLAAYERVFDDVQHFVDLISSQDVALAEARAVMHEAKDRYDAAKAEVAAAQEARDGTKHTLFVYLRPGPTEILPLFDRMEPPDEEKHGAHSEQWRKEPISALRLSLPATNLLTAADVIFIGQLQDRMQDDPDEWWMQIEGLTQPVAFAVADRLADFIDERTGGK